VPRACDLGQVVPQLAALRCYEGVVDLPLAKAAALDPDRLARLPGEQGRGAREARPRQGRVGLGPCLELRRRRMPLPRWTRTASRACPTSRRAAPGRRGPAGACLALPGRARPCRSCAGAAAALGPGAARACPASAGAATRGQRANPAEAYPEPPAARSAPHGSLGMQIRRCMTAFCARATYVLLPP